MMTPITLLNSADFARVTRQDLSLIAFGTPWSSPCQSQHKILARLTKSYGDIMTIARVDVESHPGIAEKSNIQTVPTLIVYRKNMEVKRLVGLQSLHALHTLLSDMKSDAVATTSGPGAGSEQPSLSKYCS
jgi:thioredoxin 1